MGSAKQAVVCDVGLGLQVTSSSPFQQGGIDDAHPHPHPLSDFAFKSPPVQAPIRGPFSFTKAQWQELERQTAVYNFLSASVPVPPQLLIPINANQPNRLLNFGIPSNGSDQEPWRCRRTDGKKWRCSRDVAPDQKYCERHAHKNRPRSRKHVELHGANLTSTPSMSASKKNNHLDPKSSSKMLDTRSQPFSRNEPQMLPYPTLASYDQTRCSFDWFAKGNTTSVDSASHQWQPKEGFMGNHSSNFFKDANIFGPRKDNPMSSNGLDLVSDGHSQNDPCGLLLGHRLDFLNDDLNLDHTERPKGFINAWSSADNDGSISRVSQKYSHPQNMSHPTSPLSLSMSGCNAQLRQEDHLDIGLMYTEQENSGMKLHQPMLNWMGTDSWMGSTPGGPLAEALCLGISSNMKSAPTHYQQQSPYGSSSYPANANPQSSSDESSHTRS